MSHFDKDIKVYSGTPSGGGVGVCGLLGVLFIALKLTHVIDWSWLWVLAPFWIPFVVFIVLVMIIFIVNIIRGAIKEYKRSKRK